MRIRSGIFVLWLCFIGHGAEASDHESLTHAFVEAYQNNPSLESERAKLRATDEAVAQAISHWRPSVDANANVGKIYQNIPAFQPFGTNNYSDTARGYGVQVTQPLFRGFKTLSETEQAEKEVAAGRAQLHAAEQKLFVDTATAYLDTLRDELILDIDRNNEDVLRQKLEETKARANEGDLTDTDVRQAESRLARSEVARLQTENTLNDDRATYQRLVGYQPGPLETPHLILDEPKSLDKAEDISLSSNPEVLAAQYAMEAAKAQVHDNEGSLLPEVDLVGSSNTNWGQGATLPGRIDTNQVLVQLKFPLYDGGADYSRIRAARETTTQKRMDLEEARHRARELIAKAWHAMLTADASIKADDNEIDAADKALAGVKIQSKAGTRTTLDVLNAEQELLDAKVDRARSEHDKDLAIVSIQSIMGRLTVEGLKLPIDGYDPIRHYDAEAGAMIGFGTEEDTYRTTDLGKNE